MLIRKIKRGLWGSSYFIATHTLLLSRVCFTKIVILIETPSCLADNGHPDMVGTTAKNAIHAPSVILIMDNLLKRAVSSTLVYASIKGTRSGDVICDSCGYN